VGRSCRPLAAQSERQWRVTGAVPAQAIRSFIELVSGPQAAVMASRKASSREAAEAVAEPVRPWNETSTLHSARWLARVDHSRKATKPSTTSKVRVRPRAVMARNLRKWCAVQQGERRGLSAGTRREACDMECPEVAERLWEYLDDELTAKEAGAVARHLDACGHCRPRYRCDRAFLLVVVRSFQAPCRAPVRLRAVVRARLAALRAAQ
jgi:mycothiol system anti-sigma-R factor